jgi:hypothetical protein
VALPSFMRKPRVIIYAVIIGCYDSVPKVNPDANVEYYLFTDKLEIPASSMWNKCLLANPSDLNSRRLSRLPKLRPHFYLPPHDVSIYIDANLTLHRPIRDFALTCVRELSLAVHPHPGRTCLYEEARQCIRLRLDDEFLINEQTSRYQREGLPPNFGLCENSFMVRRNTKEVNKFNDFWHDEYHAGSQRDQLSFMYCLWRSRLHPYLIWQNPRKNSYFKREKHLSNYQSNNDFQTAIKTA